MTDRVRIDGVTCRCPWRSEARKPQAAFLVSLVATLSGTSWHLMANML